MKRDIAEIASFLENVSRTPNHPTAQFWRGYWFDTGHYKRLLQVLEKLDPVLQNKPVLLDIGSFGEFPLILRKFYEFPVVYANSIEGDFIGYGKGQLLQAGDPNAEISFVIEPCDVERQHLPQARETVDVVTCFEVLEHLRYDPMFMMLEVHRILRDGGLLILSTPNASSWESLARVARLESPFIFSSYFADGSGIGHCKEYSASEIHQLVDNAGFAMEKIETFDSIQPSEAFRGKLRELKDQLRFRRALWKESLRGQTFLICARKAGRPKMRKYFPLYTENVPYRPGSVREMSAEPLRGFRQEPAAPGHQTKTVPTGVAVQERDGAGGDRAQGSAAPDAHPKTQSVSDAGRSVQPPQEARCGPSPPLVIRVRNLSKCYRIYDHRWDKLREVLHLGKGLLHKEFWALRDVSFEVEPGQTIGLMGQNGSGKSTLLQILAGIMSQTRGDCFVNGKVSALLELGSGFNPEFTGRENVFMNGAILGMDERRMKERFDAIAQFAEIGDFMNQPVKTYSSGMFMRLAFAVAVNVDPDILLVDEALAVGDLIFQHRCMHRMNRLRDSGKTIVLATHDLTAITKFCDRALLLDEGRLLEDGRPDLVVQKYRALIFDRERRYAQFDGDEDRIMEAEYGSGAGMPVARTIPNVDHRFGNGEASLLGVELLNEKGFPTRDVPGGQRIIIRVSVQFNQDVDRPILGYTLRDRLGVDISACNTAYVERHLPPARKGQIYTTDFHIQLPHLAAGSYSISPAVARGTLTKHDMCDWIDNAMIFNVRAVDMVYGVVKLDVDARNYVSEAAAGSQA